MEKNLIGDKTLEELAEKTADAISEQCVSGCPDRRMCGPQKSHVTQDLILSALQSATAAQQKEIEELTTILQQITTPQTIEHLREQLRNKRKYAT